MAAASDLAPAQQALAAGFAKRSQKPLRFALGSSGQLANQIRNGAPYDVYLSANRTFVDDLAREGKLVPGSVRLYARGRLALWSREGAIKDVAGLDSIRHIAMANPAHAPYGVAARDFLERAGLWSKLEPKIVYGENVRQAFQFAESGNAEAAIIAWTLVHDRGGVLLPDSGHSPIEQAAGVVAASGRKGTAAEFIAWLTAPDGQAILRAAGLFPPVP